MDAHDVKRRLIRHGILLFLLGLLVGMFVQSVRNPRKGLSAHVGTVMSGMFLAILGAVWEEVHLDARATTATYALALYAMYVSSAGLLLAALFGTRSSTPLIGAGFGGSPWQEALVSYRVS